MAHESQVLYCRYFRLQWFKYTYIYICIYVITLYNPISPNYETYWRVLTSWEPFFFQIEVGIPRATSFHGTWKGVHGTSLGRSPWPGTEGSMTAISSDCFGPFRAFRGDSPMKFGSSDHHPKRCDIADVTEALCRAAFLPVASIKSHQSCFHTTFRHPWGDLAVGWWARRILHQDWWRCDLSQAATYGFHFGWSCGNRMIELLQTLGASTSTHQP